LYSEDELYNVLDELLIKTNVRALDFDIEGAG
jgi:hypothetical protein